MIEREQDEAWLKYLERYRNDGRQIHKPTGTPGYDEQEWLAFEFAWNYLQAALADRPEQDFRLHGAGAVQEFAKLILHGDDKHRAWLMEAANAWSDGRPLPKPTSAYRPEHDTANDVEAPMRQREIADAAETSQLVQIAHSEYRRGYKEGLARMWEEDRPEQPVAPEELTLPDRLDWYADRFPAMRSDLYAAATHIRKSPAYAAPVARPEPAQSTELDGGYHRGLADGFDEAKRQMAQEPAQPVAHRQRLRYAFGDVWAYWDDETSQPMVGDQGPVYVGTAHPLYAAQPETRVSMGWVRLDTAGEIIELASDEKSGWHEIFRDAYCSCVPSNDGEHGIGCEMHIYATPSHPAPSEPLCPSCKGSGEMEVMERVEGTADQAWPVTVDCDRCGGTGVAPSEVVAERQSKDDHAAHLEAQRQQRIGASLWGSEGPSYAKPAKGDAS